MAAVMVALSAVETSFSTSRRKGCLSPLPPRRPSLFFLYAPEPSLASKIPPLGTRGWTTLRLFARAVSPVRSLSSYPSTECACETEAEETRQSGLSRLLLCALVWKAFVFASCVACGACLAADGSIRASSLGLKVATALRRIGWPDEAVVFAVATLPVLELRGAIPVGYWMQLDPLKLTVLSILGNMAPVPFIILYLKRFASFVSQRSAVATRFVNLLFERAREKAGPVEEFQWLGLMLFVAVPFPGTGAWTGAIIASILDMPFWSAFSANFVGVVLAGLLVHLLVNLGLKYAVLTGLLMFFASTVIWSVLRSFKRSINSN
ncbi:Putative small multi-drug export protein [Musa troglodytarum]|uniref:Small multi-drug export protein n=2 Tax=Musa TaxID=4640 RepID=A0A9E7HHV7_9LILI|nr:Putative small multi-drug export protein [Musa troglodytarum]